jgi:hypothetical protein
MYRWHMLLCWILLPALVRSHGCPSFNLTDAETRNELLQYGDRTVPASIKDWINAYSNDTVITGVYDCHEDVGGYEIGVTAACTSDGNCTCTALYNFNECQSCELNCNDDIANLDEGSFSADCSNVKSDISETCSVECGYTTTDCFPTSASLPLTFSKVRALAILVVFALFQ